MSNRHDHWRGWVWHLLACRVECDGHRCACTCHQPREEPTLTTAATRSAPRPHDNPKDQE